MDNEIIIYREVETEETDTLTTEQTLPNEGRYYVLASNGIFYHKNTGFIEAMVEVESIPSLKKMEPWASFKLKLPVEIITQAYLFFKRVYRLFGTEAAVLIYYSEEHQAFELYAPKQEVTGASAHYPIEGRSNNGWYLVGDIHSHASMSAFHSGTDIRDEENFDGLHITLGKMNRQDRLFEIESTVAVNKNRFPVDPTEVIAGIVKAESTSFSKIKNKPARRSVKKFLYDTLINDDRDDYGADYYHRHSDKLYFITLEGIDREKAKVPPEWMKNVRERTYERYYRKSKQTKYVPKNGSGLPIMDDYMLNYLTGNNFPERSADTESLLELKSDYTNYGGE